ncbi:MAG TPA: methionine aminopeptidase [Dermatophilaceae bacterium]|nr:methionine aminopeptidase [Dermatophilaceae bacterium]
MPYWFNVTTGRVEDDSNRSKNDEVLGPYESYADASNALQQARENTERWDREDREWEEGS